MKQGCFPMFARSKMDLCCHSQEIGFNYPDLEYYAMVLFGLRELKGFALGMAAAQELAKL